MKVVTSAIWSEQKHVLSALRIDKLSFILKNGLKIESHHLVCRVLAVI